MHLCIQYSVCTCVCIHMHPIQATFSIPRACPIPTCTRSTYGTRSSSRATSSRRAAPRTNGTALAEKANTCASCIYRATSSRQAAPRTNGTALAEKGKVLGRPSLACTMIHVQVFNLVARFEVHRSACVRQPKCGVEARMGSRSACPRLQHAYTMRCVFFAYDLYRYVLRYKRSGFG